MDKLELINEIFRLCIIPLFSVLTAYLVKFIQSKSDELQTEAKNELCSKYISLLTEIVLNCVISTNQTYVEALKNKNAFTKEEQEEAFRRTKESVMSLLTEDAKRCLVEIYGDLGTLVDTLIESQVALNK